ncbi:hypothetical protein F5882DRAFT_394002 [Hyaloscypha sp. PMI_1271]|nr:hypothetical protein F5882DRAFT_394002 [Hyaloscypha sp. PMI_1271]
MMEGSSRVVGAGGGGIGVGGGGIGVAVERALLLTGSVICRHLLLPSFFSFSSFLRCSAFLAFFLIGIGL